MSRDALLPRIPFAPLALAAGVAIALAVSLLPVPGSAQNEGSGGAADEQPTMGTVTLQPGANEIGWIVEIANPQVLFDEIAELESIWTWHALDQRWQVAARDVPSSLWTLYRLVPGTGLRLLIRGDSPVRWERSLTPARGKVELQPGDNFVAWAGRDGWDVNQLAKGIGRQLREIHRRNTGTGGLDRIWPVAEGAEAATVARGEALWVKMPRSIVWLQPTDVMPRLVFPGGAPENVQAAARRDLRNTLDYFATEYGIQADVTELTIYMPLELDAFKQQLRDEREEVDDIALDDIWSRTAGWAGDRLIIKRYANESSAVPVADISYQGTMTHEYFHRVQEELRNRGSYDATWVVEGSAVYAEWDQQVAAGERTWPEIVSNEQQRMYDDVPRLLSTEFENGTWQYYLGSLALQRLVERSELSAWIDFYRELAPTRIGPTSRWQSILPWRDVFALTFDIKLDEFYVAFDEWQANLAVRNGSRPADAAFDEPARIEGRIVRADGSTVAGRFVSADEIVLSPSGERYPVGWTQRAETDVEGNFSVIAPNDGQYMLRIDLDDEQHCGIYYSREGGATTGRDLASLVRVAGADIRVDIRIPDDYCRNTINGRLLKASGEPMAGVPMRILITGAGVWFTAYTDRTGVFHITVPQDDSYLIQILLVNIHSCGVRFASEGVTADYAPARRVHVAGEDIHIGDIQIPDNYCRSTISGRLLDASGVPMADVDTQAIINLNWGIWYVAFSRTDADGAFVVTVPEDGDYFISIRPTEGCNLYFAGGNVTARYVRDSLIRVAGGDVRVGDIWVPVGICDG